MTTVNSAQPESASLWRPLRSALFRNLLLADVISDIGTFIQGVAAAWLMVSLKAGPMYVALVQTAAALPFFLLALPAGAVGDIFDRRKVILLTETTMAAVAVVLACLSLAGMMSPVLLLILTFALSAGDAFETPTWRAVLPELVQKEDLSSASALNGIEFNLARAVGPALGGMLIAFAGVGFAFLVNAVSFIGVIVVVARWQRPAVKRTSPPETVAGATVTALRYVRYSPVIRSVMLRVSVAMFFSSGFLALLPSIAHRANNSAIGYGVLLGGFGFGAVLGAFIMQRARKVWPVDAIISAGIAVFGLAAIAAGTVRGFWSLCWIMLFAGASWVSFVSLFNVQVLNRAPDWVRARVLAITLLGFQGAIAAGSAVWGAVAEHVGLSQALLWAGGGALLSATLGLFLRIPDRDLDLSPWIHWRVPALAGPDSDLVGPVLVTVEYKVHADQSQEFLKTMRHYERLRRRDGASRWGVCRDAEFDDRYIETFIVSSWAEHLRQHTRAIRADVQLDERLHQCFTGEPNVRHLLFL